MVELLRQPQYVPMDVVDQIISIFAGGNGHLDDLPLDQVASFEKGLLEHFSTAGKSIRDELEKKCAFDDPLRSALNDAITAYKVRFQAGAATGAPAKPSAQEPEPAGVGA